MELFSTIDQVIKTKRIEEPLPSHRGLNTLIQGDNSKVIPELTKQLKGEVRCIYIDPPYNNQETYSHYTDRGSSQDWLEQISSLVTSMWPLLSEDGSLWISIDDRELHYLKVGLDRVLGRAAFITTIIWEQRTTRENRRVFSNNHEYLLVYAKNPKKFKSSRNRLPLNEAVLARYSNPDSDPRGLWQSVSANVQGGHATPNQFYELKTPSGRRITPPSGRCWSLSRERMIEEIEKGNVWFGREGTGVPRLKKFLEAEGGGLTPETLWRADQVGTSKSAKKQLLKLFPNDVVFDTPKPEQLLKRVFEVATNRGDLVLDAFLGSGTSAAVAHKLQRRYIGIERSEDVFTLASKRLQKVVDGDPTGISEEIGWRGGGEYSLMSFKC